jgi:acetyltransferase-like isoleucine patch superfamily enzyme
MPTNAGSIARSLRRGLVTGGAALATSPLWGPALLQAGLTGGEGVFKTCADFLSLVPGKLGVVLRRGFYRMTLEACAGDCHIGFGTTLTHRQLRIAQGVYIGNRCTIGQAVIEADVTIGSNVDVLSGRHQHHFDRPDVPLREQGGRFERVRIGRNSWVGNSAVVMAEVGAACVIGAGSVVVRPIPDGAVAVGNPAVVKKRRPAPAADQRRPAVAAGAPVNV